ncbi:formyl transferase [Zychaea mexicana]|uniref:formyl transferase n=1 Tax=Zychaea mexicana TaxID=64656 RepID=UPI0022FE1492|nr:formyl transferase [Zychaea mexicana]KAI9488042.1 formyl transferase [Zychaea mexicana]
MLRTTILPCWSAAFRRSVRSSFLQHARHHAYTTQQAGKNKFKVVFFGTDDFAVKHLKELILDKAKPNSCIASIDLVCPPDRKTGRKLKNITPSPTKGIAELYSIPVHHTPENAKTLEGWKLPGNGYDLGVVVSFGYFVPADIIHGLKHGAVNVHPSLLPKYRGAAPIQHTILAGDDVTGVTVQELDDKKFDAGRILAQQTMDLSRVNAPNYRFLKEKLGDMGRSLLINTLHNFDKCKKNAKVQDLSQVSSAPKIKKEWSEIVFDDMRAWQIEQLYRAIGDQYPLRTTFTFTRIKRSKKIKQRHITMQLLNMFLPDDSPLYYMENEAEPGTFVYDEKTSTLHISCADGGAVAVTHIKAEGSDVISARDFINGYEIRDQMGQFGYFSEEDIHPEMSGVRVTKRREEYNKTIRRRMKMRKKEFEEVYGKKPGRGRW